MTSHFILVSFSAFYLLVIGHLLQKAAEDVISAAFAVFKCLQSCEFTKKSFATL